MKLKIYLYFIYIYMLKNSCNLRIEKTTFLIFKNYKNWLNKLIILLEIWNNRFNEKSIFLQKFSPSSVSFRRKRIKRIRIIEVPPFIRPVEAARMEEWRWEKGRGRKKETNNQANNHEQPKAFLATLPPRSRFRTKRTSYFLKTEFARLRLGRLYRPRR